MHGSLVLRLFPPPVFDRFCSMQNKKRGGNGLGPNGDILHGVPINKNAMQSIHHRRNVPRLSLDPLCRRTCMARESQHISQLDDLPYNGLTSKSSEFDDTARCYKPLSWLANLVYKLSIVRYALHYIHVIGYEQLYILHGCIW